MSSDSTAERTVVFDVQAPQTTLLSVNMSSITKLTTQNYLMWCRQVRALLEGHELHYFIDGSTQIPEPQITVNGSSVSNPAFTPWKRQDRLLYSALIGTISLSVQSVISTANTTKEVWDTLAQAFGNPTRGHIRQLKMQIRACTKGSKTMADYLRQIKAKTDDLALLGKPMEAEDITEQILAGLGEEYKPEIDAINGRDRPISYTELYEKLINREAMILCAESSSAAPIVANAVDTRNRSQPRGNSGRNYSTGYGQPRNNNGGNNTRNSRPYQGRCQACGELGHSAKFCPQFKLVKGPSRSSSPWPASAPPSWQQSPQPQQWPRANHASMSDSGTWLLDSGASHHMISDLSNLASHNPYYGGEDVLLGDGSALSITHTGSLSLPYYTRPFFVKNILCVPSLDKNLISVFQLCKTNNVSVTFTPTYFQVRDLLTGTLRLEGKPANGTYEWPKTAIQPSVAFASTVKATVTDGHSRLGHPALSILKKSLSIFRLPVSFETLSNAPCTACFSNKMHKLPFGSSSLSSSQPLELIFSDVWTSPVMSFDGFKYYVIFVDHFTRYVWLYPLK